MTLVISEEAVRVELWTSFVSLMRSHLAALDITGTLNAFRVEELTPNAILITDGVQTLSLCVWPSGDNLWVYHDEAAGDLTYKHWVLNTDATVIIYDGEPAVDMELAVEAFAAMLARMRN